MPKSIITVGDRVLVTNNDPHFTEIKAGAIGTVIAVNEWSTFQSMLATPDPGCSYSLAVDFPGFTEGHTGFVLRENSTSANHIKSIHARPLRPHEKGYYPSFQKE